MKRILAYSFALIALLLSSCSKDELIPEVTFPVGTTDYFQTSIDFDNKAGEKTISFTSNVAWSASVDETRDGSSWCSVSPSNGEAGQAVLKISVKENTTYDDRNAVVRLTYGDSIKSIFVNQKQLDALTLTSDRFEIPVSGGTVTVEVKSNIDYQVNISEDCKDWIHQSETKGTRALVASNLTFTIDPSYEYDKREGQIEITSGDKKEIVTVYQAGEGILTLTKKEFNISSSEQDIAIEVKSNFEYSVELPQVDWLTENTAQTRSVSTHTINLHVKENQSYDNRSTSIIVYDKNSNLSEEVIINQSQKNALQLDTKEFSFDENGGEFTVNINSNVDYKVKIGDNWITEETTPSTRALASSSHTFKVSEMSGNNDRETTITFSDKTTGITDEVIVKQSRKLFFESNAITLMLDDSKELSYTNKTEENLTWKSSNPSIVSVDNNGKVMALSKGNATITISTPDSKHTSSCYVTVKDITDCISMARTGTGMSVGSTGTTYTVTFTITNSSPETIHIVSLAGVTSGVAQDLYGGESVSIKLGGPTSYIQAYLQTLVYTYKGKQYSING